MQFTSRLTGEFSQGTTSELDGETAYQNTLETPPGRRFQLKDGTTASGTSNGDGKHTAGIATNKPHSPMFSCTSGCPDESNWFVTEIKCSPDNSAYIGIESTFSACSNLLELVSYPLMYRTKSPSTMEYAADGNMRFL